jgi:hypothetical protein
MKELAVAFGVDPNMVSRRLRQSSIALRQRGLADEQVIETVVLYETG